MNDKMEWTTPKMIIVSIEDTENGIDPYPFESTPYLYYAS